MPLIWLKDPAKESSDELQIKRLNQLIGNINTQQQGELSPHQEQLEKPIEKTVQERKTISFWWFAIDILLLLYGHITSFLFLTLWLLYRFIKNQLPDIKQQPSDQLSNVFPTSITLEETPMHESIETFRPEASNCQDGQWLSVVSSYSGILSKDLELVSNAVMENDYLSILLYTKPVFANSQKAIEDSEMYSVSPYLQLAKDEFRLAMILVNWAAYYLDAGIEEMNNGDQQVSTYYLEQAITNIESFHQHMDNSNTMLDSYSKYI